MENLEVVLSKLVIDLLHLYHYHGLLSIDKVENITDLPIAREEPDEA